MRKVICALAITLPLAAAAQEARPALKGVSAIRAGNYNSPSVMLDTRDKVAPIIEELNALRRRPWRAGELKLNCYATVVMLASGKPAATFRVRPEGIVETQLGKEQRRYSIETSAADLPRLNRLLAEIAPAKDCP